MTALEYLELKRSVIDAGYAKEIDWAHDIKPCEGAMEFWQEFSWVVICSGMKEQIARKIWDKVRPWCQLGLSASDRFGHAGKATAIDEVFRRRFDLFSAYLSTADDGRVAFLETLPWIGPITKWHLAKNLGMNVCKPDRHLVRIFGRESNVTPACQKLVDETGDRLTEVDTVIWRAANLGLV